MPRGPKGEKQPADGQRRLSLLNTTEDNTHKELIFIQKARLEDIRELKRYQWQSTYYSILAHGGLIALSNLFTNPQGILYRLTISAACFFIFAAWLMINNVIEIALARARNARDGVYELFSETAKQTRITTPMDRMHIYPVLRTVVLGSTILAAITVYVSPN